MRSRPFTINIGTGIALAVVVYLAYYLLIRDNSLHTSITAILAYANHLTMKQHLIVLALLPIYIATIIFGSGMLGLYLGPRLDRLLHRALKNK